ncbi:MAG: hypothetical protein U0271_12620 [Polyangiaceae bacterium]
MEKSSAFSRRSFLVGASVLAVAPLAACGGGGRLEVSSAEQVVGGVVSIVVKEGYVKGGKIKIKIIMRSETDEAVVVDRGNFGVKLPSGTVLLGEPGKVVTIYGISTQPIVRLEAKGTEKEISLDWKAKDTDLSEIKKLTLLCRKFSVGGKEETDIGEVEMTVTGGEGGGE